MTESEKRPLCRRDILNPCRGFVCLSNWLHVHQGWLRKRAGLALTIVLTTLESMLPPLPFAPPGIRLGLAIVIPHMGRIGKPI